MSIFLINNKNLYAFYLAGSYGLNSDPNITKQVFLSTKSDEYTDSEYYHQYDLFRQKINNGTITIQDVIYYVNAHVKDGEKAFRYFLNNIIFGIFQIFSAMLVFNIRKPHHNWKKDVGTMIMVCDNKLILSLKVLEMFPV